MESNQQAAISQHNDEPQVDHQRHQRTEQRGDAREAHLLRNDCIDPLFKTVDHDLLRAEGLDRADAADDLFHRLGHGPQGLLGTLGALPDAWAEPPDQQRNNQQRPHPGQGQAPIHMHNHQVDGAQQHGQAAGPHVDPLGNQLPHHLHVTQGVGEHVTHTVAVIVGRGKAAPFLEQLPPQAIGKKTPLAMHDDASRPARSHANHADQADQPHETGHLPHRDRAVLKTVGDATHQAWNQCGKEAAGRDQTYSDQVDRPVLADVGTDYAPTRHVSYLLRHSAER